MVSSLDSASSQPSSGAVSLSQKMPPRSRTQSISSDRPSTIAHSFMSPPLSVSPEAAFIAASAASQIVTNDHDSHADAWYDQHGIEPSGEPAMVSPAALQLVNNFLDQLLFNFLATARSTTLGALRPAVSEVLKPKLAKDAINQADEELREYLGGDDEDMAEAQSPDPVSPRDWDLELAWKRTRLRCMVYSSLGDMEEEDEDFYMEQEHLDAGLDDRLSEVVSPAVAIFLTSILEFMGEQALIVAGQASYHRMRVKYEKEFKDGARSPSVPTERIVIEELDMERVALDRTLGRLWRAWKKKIRSPGITTMDQRLSRSYSRDSMRGGSSHLRSPSSITAEPAVPPTVPEPVHELEGNEVQEENIEQPLEEYLFAAGIPLPIGSRDVDEIEVPGLSYYSDDETEADEEEELPMRPKSWMVFTAPIDRDQTTPTQSQPEPPKFFRQRSNSLPTPPTAPYNAVVGGETEDEQLEQEPAADGVDDIRSPAQPVQSPKGGWSESEETTPVSSTDPANSEGQDEDDEDEDSLIEEPQILVSSRVSISGRSISPAVSERAKPAVINTNLPVRTPSIHSARLVDVTGPRSPALGSRRSSGDVTENVRQANPVRVSGVMTPPIIEEKMRRSPDSMSAFRSPAVKSGLSGSHSISETEEVAEPMQYETTASTSPTSSSAGVGTSLAAIPEPTTTDVQEEAFTVPKSGSVFGSVAQRSQAPPSPAKQVTKVTIISSTAPGGTFYAEDKHEPPRKASASHVRPQPTTPTSGSFTASAPSVPERSTGRQPVTASPPKTQPSPPRTQPSTIGQVSVERSRNRSPSEPFPSRSQETSSATRPQHTSGSTSSTSTTRLKPVRTSEETTRSRIDVARNFEELIHSDQTIQYTLTPESMRDIDAQSNRSNLTGSPVIPVKTRKSEEARQTGDRSRSSSFAQSTEIKRSISVSRSTGGASQAVDSQRKNSLQNVQSNTSAPRSGPSVPAKPRGVIPQAPRDARLPRESLAEFADFIRSTGPDGGSVGRNPPVVPPAPAKISVEAGRASTTSSINRMRLQARDPTTDYKDDNSDLIDFIRRGPPSTGGNPRIPRTVAPFRTTMDSDQLSGAVGGRAVDAQLRDYEVRSSQASTTETPSIQSSINSQSALLGRNKPLPSGNSRFAGPGDDDMPMPKRKTRRVRDPYAIDLSDEDDEFDDEPTPRARRRQEPQEESLMDFLRSVPPPPPEPVRQVAPPAKPKKKASAPSLMARFTRRDSGRNSGNSSGSSSPRSPVPPAMAAPRPANGPATGAKGYIPIQVNMPPGVDKYNPANFSKTTPTMGGGNNRPAGRVAMKKFEPREAVSVSSRGTSELAEFFKNSAPPMGPDDNGFPPRYAGRGKKTSVAS
ncbi:hypothetical protein QBC47DRAFT_119223 [Echria macrotheca]|uniref:Uncharacterized protein n=1 Tax=Echria macrotheca TaxID=438768 RepID=A0AAJ0F4P8_9PEZI|nr:hypothetical protein QBC47DRAFT_119223 [Echria macrotheca]